MLEKPKIQRRESTKIYVGNVPIGGDAPIAVQSMTNTRTTDVESTVAQIKSLERVGAGYCGDGDRADFAVDCETACPCAVDLGVGEPADDGGDGAADG